VSLRRRILLGCLIVAVVLLGTDAVLASTFRSYLVGRVDKQLDEAAGPLLRGEQFRGGFPGDGGSHGDGGPHGDGGGKPGGGPEPDHDDGGEDRVFTEFFVGVASSDGSVSRLGPGFRGEKESPPRLTAQLVERHRGAPGGDFHPFTVDATEGSGLWRVVTFSRPSDGQTVVVGLSLHEMSATLRRMLLVVAVATVGVLVALGAMAIWVLRLGVRPLAEMAETAGAIAGGDLSRRVEHADQRTEAGQLGSAINRMLEQIEDAFGQRSASEGRLRRFVADASHELRTPLTSIRGYAELWRAGGLSDPGQLAEAMRRMEQEARRMGVLVDDLLLLARLDQGRPLDLTPIRLDQLVADAVGDARAVEPERPIELAVEEATVHADQHGLRQVAANLLANARVHTPPGTPVRVSLRAVDGWARFEVADDGPGLPPEVAERVFERFYRGDPARTRARGAAGVGRVPQGSGLGLSIVAAVAQAHGGRVAVETTPGEGARFMVDLPLSPEKGAQ